MPFIQIEWDCETKPEMKTIKRLGLGYVSALKNAWTSAKRIEGTYHGVLGFDWVTPYEDAQLEEAFDTPMKEINHLLSELRKTGVRWVAENEHGVLIFPNLFKRKDKSKRFMNYVSQ